MDLPDADVADAREMPVRTTPKRAGTAPAAGSRHLSDCVAENLRALRARARFSQTELAERMTSVGHPWSRATVSDIERAARNLSLNEAFALGLILNTTLPALLDPRGIDGQDDRAVDYGGGRILPAEVASDYLHGRTRVSIPDPGTVSVEGSTQGVLKAAAKLIEAGKKTATKRPAAKRSSVQRRKKQ